MRAGPGTTGEQVRRDVLGPDPARPRCDNGVLAHQRLVADALEGGGPAGDPADFIQEPHPPPRLWPVHRRGQVAAEHECATEVLGGEVVSWDVD